MSRMYLAHGQDIFSASSSGSRDSSSFDIYSRESKIYGLGWPHGYSPSYVNWESMAEGEPFWNGGGSWISSMAAPVGSWEAPKVNSTGTSLIYDWARDQISGSPLGVFSMLAENPFSNPVLYYERLKEGVKFYVPTSIDQDILALFSGSQWANGTITYSLPDSRSDYEMYHPSAGGFESLSIEREDAFHHIFTGSSPNPDGKGIKLTSLASFTNVNWVYAGRNDADIKLAGYAPNSIINESHGYYPGIPRYSGSVWVEDIDNPYIGEDYRYHLLLHELGHALGLKHPHDSGGRLPKMRAEVDSTEYTVMSYNGPASPQTFMMLDIAALQEMYGADYTTNSGDTVYEWDLATGEAYVNGVGQGRPPGDRIFLTIWDGGGNDTYNLRKFYQDAVIDLTPGKYSCFTEKIDRKVKGNVYNSLLHKGDPRSLIENAIAGSGDDKIIGNEVDNKLTGNGGSDTIDGHNGHDNIGGGAENDSIYGGLGNDTIGGDAGEDTVYGGSGLDHLWGNNGQDVLYGGYGNDVLRGNSGADRLYGDSGNDALYGDGEDDTLDGGSGNDTLYGGDGNDFLFCRDGYRTQMTGGSGSDNFRISNVKKAAVITDFAGGWGIEDKIEFYRDLFSSFGEVKAAAYQNGSDVVIAKNGVSLTLNNVDLNKLVADDFAFIAYV